MVFGTLPGKGGCRKSRVAGWVEHKKTNRIKLLDFMYSAQLTFYDNLLGGESPKFEVPYDAAGVKRGPSASAGSPS